VYIEYDRLLVYNDSVIDFKLSEYEYIVNQIKRMNYKKQAEEYLKKGDKQMKGNFFGNLINGKE